MVADKVLNICFHGIGTPRRSLEPGEDAYWLETSSFLRILDEIATWPTVAISFDDANESDAELALPALRERELTAQFFLIAGRLDDAGSLSAGQVRELTANGMSVGMHGMTHRPWRAMAPEVRDLELAEARRRLEDVVGSPVTEAACPLGRYDRGALTALRQLGYQRVYTSDRRPARRGSWLQPRFSLRRTDTPESLRTDVLAPPRIARQAQQSVKGLIKRWI
jgi:peptidoglycan/xylan/chitin deacetylase (PgdA/CDA1 family)